MTDENQRKRKLEDRLEGLEERVAILEQEVAVQNVLKKPRKCTNAELDNKLELILNLLKTPNYYIN